MFANSTETYQYLPLKKSATIFFFSRKRQSKVKKTGIVRKKNIKTVFSF